MIKRSKTRWRKCRPGPNIPTPGLRASSTPSVGATGVSPSRPVRQVRRSQFLRHKFSDQRGADQYTSSGSSLLVGGPAALFDKCAEARSCDTDSATNGKRTGTRRAAARCWWAARPPCSTSAQKPVLATQIQRPTGSGPVHVERQLVVGGRPSRPVIPHRAKCLQIQHMHLLLL